MNTQIPHRWVASQVHRCVYVRCACVHTSFVFICMAFCTNYCIMRHLLTAGSPHSHVGGGSVAFPSPLSYVCMFHVCAYVIVGSLRRANMSLLINTV